MIGAWPKIIEKTKPTNSAWRIASYCAPAATWGQPEEEKPGHGQPRVAGQQRRRDEARQPRPPHGAPRDVEGAEPCGERDEAHAHQPHAVIRRERGAPESDEEHAGRGDEGEAARGGRPLKSREVEPLADDREHEEARPPPDHAMHRLAAEPERLADDPAQGAQRHDDGEERHLPSQDRDERGDHHQAAEQHQLHPAGHAGREGERAEAARDRTAVRPRASERHGALEPDHRAEEPRDHQGAVEGHERSGDGQWPSEARQSPRERGQEGQHGQRHEGQAHAQAAEDGGGVRGGGRAAIGWSLPAPPIAGRAHARIITRIILIRVSALTACG